MLGTVDRVNRDFIKDYVWHATLPKNVILDEGLTVDNLDEAFELHKKWTLTKSVML